MDRTEELTVRPEEVVRQLLIRDLVERYPAAMQALSQYGIDTCCGGGMTVPAAAEAHGHDPEIVVERVLRAVSGSEE